MRQVYLLLAVLGIGLVAGTTQANAQAVTYTFSGDLSGTLNGTPFTNDPFTLTLTADSAGTGPLPPYSILASPGAVADVMLAGVGSGVSLAPVNAFVVPGQPIVGFIDPLADTGFDISAPGLGNSYALLSSGGPQTGTFFNEGPGFSTSLGVFDFTGFTGTFTATVDTPEPGSIALLGGMGIASATFLLRSRRSR